MTESKAPESGRPVSEMLERIARALYGLDCEPRYWVEESEDVRGDYRRSALAAMKAMREPTPEMEKTGDAFIDFGSDFTETWRAALDAEISIAEGGKDG